MKLSSLVTEETLAPHVLAAFLLIFAAFRITSTSLESICAPEVSALAKTSLLMTYLSSLQPRLDALSRGGFK